MVAGCGYPACLAKVIQARDVPDEVYTELVRQAGVRGMSLNRFINAEFERIARRGRNAEVFATARGRTGDWPSGEEIVSVVRAERDRDGGVPEE